MQIRRHIQYNKKINNERMIKAYISVKENIR